MSSTRRPELRVKRIYEAPESSDGYRVLVDRIWPRGITKQAAMLDAWCKDVAPSTQLRKWLHHDLSRWDAFRKKYFAELDSNRLAVEELLDACSQATLTLVFAASDQRCNNATALKDYLEMQRASRH